MSDYYVYAYYEKGGTDPFYVGKGKDTRDTEHLEYKNLKRDTPLAKKLRSLVEPPEVHRLADGITEAEAFDLEIKLIAQFGLRWDGGCLLNCTYGGEGVSGHRHSDATRAKIAAKRKLQAPPSAEQRKALSKRVKGNKYAVGNVMPTRRPIVCKLGVLVIKQYDYIAEAAKDGFCVPNIQKCLKGKRIFADGYQWEYL
jgi:hypothetical protein